MEEMAPHSSTLAWKIPWTEEPGGLQSMGSRRVRHDSATSLSLFTFMHWRRKWQPTPVFLLGESRGQRSLVGCRLWGRTESDMTDATQQQQTGRWITAVNAQQGPVCSFCASSSRGLLQIGFYCLSVYPQRRQPHWGNTFPNSYCLHFADEWAKLLIFSLQSSTLM